MKFYTGQNVFDAALNRIRWLFDEFDNVTVNFSGGKDSTVCLYLALMIAEEKGRLPLNVLFIDQEAEWETVIGYVRRVMRDPRIRPRWLQVPFKLANSASNTESWLEAWKPGAEWIRPKEPNSIHENIYGSDRFADLFSNFHKVEFNGQKALNLAGVRAEESPARLKGLTSYETYKGETWGKVGDKRIGLYDMYPIYDWSYTDVWKAIHAHGWPYCRLYDFMYQHGVPVANMRVSSVTHETALKNLFFLQEIEGETWNKITERVQGISTIGQLKEDAFKPKALPPMFRDWEDYRDHLLKNLITDPVQQATMRKQFASFDRRYVPEVMDDLRRTQIAAILTNDYHGTKLSVFTANNGRFSKNAGTKGAFKNKGMSYEGLVYNGS
jgi:predicted phosphoadenosine phosphosulfate sulfurtransferase